MIKKQKHIFNKIKINMNNKSSFNYLIYTLNIILGFVIILYIFYKIVIKLRLPKELVIFNESIINCNLLFLVTLSTVFYIYICYKCVLHIKGILDK